mmetsp:Transcript_12708/g.19685  ORF Transcript_12708/g.19685 Transcript_12708/m.19685 type:complete len:313 (-) Transcript_12708:152-1090(-)
MAESKFGFSHRFIDRGEESEWSALRRAVTHAKNVVKTDPALIGCYQRYKVSGKFKMDGVKKPTGMRGYATLSKAANYVIGSTSTTHQSDFYITPKLGRNVTISDCDKYAIKNVTDLYATPIFVEEGSSGFMHFRDFALGDNNADQCVTYLDFLAYCACYEKLASFRNSRKFEQDFERDAIDFFKERIYPHFIAPNPVYFADILPCFQAIYRGFPRSDQKVRQQGGVDVHRDYHGNHWEDSDEDIEYNDWEEQLNQRISKLEDMVATMQDKFEEDFKKIRAMMRKTTSRTYRSSSERAKIRSALRFLEKKLLG